MNQINKNELRKKYKEVRKLVTNKKDKSILICQKIIDSGLLDKVKVIAFYSALLDEVDLSFLFARATKKNIICCFPKVISDNEMIFYHVKNLHELQIQKFGIKEPVGNEEVVDGSTIEVMLVPLLSFDDECNRLGYGKGYYDCYCNKYKNFKKIGVAFKEQKCKFLKDVVSGLDVPLDKIFTD